MIAHFADEATEDLFHGVSSKKAQKIPQVLWAVARRKLDMLNAAYELSDLRVPPGNMLEKLTGKKWSGFYSIRINNQYRIVFNWAEHSAHEVQIVDYH